MYTRVRFEWDPAKNASNAKKHGIDFETARLVFDDPLHVAFIDSIEGGEERWHAIGMIEDIITITVVHGYRVEGSDEVIRLISARRATSHERNMYAKTDR
ncbi:MAG: BrnT family toxin [Bryobacteraceae bacterium]|jgi:uncharacterized DUF497 family protein